MTAFTILLKLSSVRMMSDASFATSVPAMPMANPTSAFFNAGPSFVPSPVTATTSRLADTLLSMMPFTRLYLSVGEERASTRNFGHTLSSRCC
uniref:Putative secreted protein n=1 Tax=Anopheles darlingi TaxID=43151 RepID=A0A2M4DIE3_ANODA